MPSTFVVLRLSSKRWFGIGQPLAARNGPRGPAVVSPLGRLATRPGAPQLTSKRALLFSTLAQGRLRHACAARIAANSAALIESRK